jgi:hypothetical protein
MSYSDDPDRVILFDDPVDDDVLRSAEHNYVHLSVRLELHAPPDFGMDLEEIENGIELAIEQARRCGTILAPPPRDLLDVRHRAWRDADLETSHRSLMAAKEGAELCTGHVLAGAELRHRDADGGLVVRVELDVCVRLVHEHGQSRTLRELGPRDDLALDDLGGDGAHRVQRSTARARTSQRQSDRQAAAGGAPGGCGSRASAAAAQRGQIEGQ